MDTVPVTPARIAAAKRFGLWNVNDAALACREVGLPFWAACALLEKESNGRNVYGHDQGGALSGFPHEVNFGNFQVFRWIVFDKRMMSNGVGPCQITFKGFFTEMDDRGLQPWVPYDNMLYGFELLRKHHDAAGTWEGAGRSYNGQSAYGVDFVVKCNEWRERLGIKGGPIE